MTEAAAPRRTAFVAARAEDRIGPVVAALAALPPATEALLVGPTREVADELGRRVARARGGASFGLARTTLHRLALDLAGPALALRGLAPAEPGAREALVRRALDGALRDGALAALRGGVSTPMPGLADAPSPAAAALRSPSFPRALAATLEELRLAGVTPSGLRARAVDLRRRSAHEAARAGSLDDLAELAERYDRELSDSHVADRAVVLVAAIAALAAGAPLPAMVAWVDVAVTSAAEAALAAAIAAHTATLVAALPRADVAARALAGLWGAVVVEADVERPGALAAVQRDLFAVAPRGATDDGAVTWVAAPGETREAVEIARRVLAAARTGTPFDAMAVVVRSREVHGAAIESALARAGIPAWFESGTRRPHPGGRALLALLACRREGLSARRFAEFLSLGEAARSGEDGAPLEGASRWERLLREAAVIGGRDRWERRIDGLVAQKRMAARADRDGLGSARAESLARDVVALSPLRAFAGPLVDALAELPVEAPLAHWADRLEAIATLALREPAPVVEAFAGLRAFGGVVGARLADVEAALDPVLRWLERPRPPRRHGRVLVTTPEGLRGRSLRLVVVPGLAERLFPPPVREDPLLSDEDREALGTTLALRKDRSGRERLQLALAVGAAEERLVVSYPRTESETGRPRVPSLYALEVLRARDGALPDLARLGRDAARDGRIAWPAPRDPADAIDEAEHDLAVLGALLAEGDRARARGRARYLLEENEHLARALRSRFARWQQRQLGPWDGARMVGEAARALVAASRPTVRAHAPSTLRHFAACPYRFFLHAVVGLRETAEPDAVERLDPATRGDLQHRALAALAAELEARGWASLPPQVLGEARLLARAITRRVGEEAMEALAPRVPRVFDDEIEELASDVETWLVFASREAGEGRWVPHRFDLAFGLPRADHLDPRSSASAATIGPYLLRGAIDAVERQVVTGELRVTDYKTGSEDAPRQLVIGGGEILQPVLYAMALEAHAKELATPGPVGSARLLYASARGGFRERSVALDTTARRAGMAVLEAVDAALERGVLPALPREGACARCTFRGLCGPDEERRARGKDDRRDGHVHGELGGLRAMR